MSHRLYTPHGLRPWARRFAGWMLLGLLLATLAPGVSRALSAMAGGPPGARPGEHWVQVCASQGTQWVRVDIGPGGEGDAAPDPSALDLCGHCTLAVERFAPLIPGLPVVPTDAGSWPLPMVAAGTGTDAPVRAAQARGPPPLA